MKLEKESEIVFNNPYYTNNNQINLDRIDKIDNQIRELESLRNQLQRSVQPAINQTFQLAPNQSSIKYVTGEDDVNKEIVFQDSVFLDKDFTKLWLKTVKGDIKTYELTQIIKKDEKDLTIERLQQELEELKGRVNNEQYDGTDATKQSKEQ